MLIQKIKLNGMKSAWTFSTDGKKWEKSAQAARVKLLRNNTNISLWRIIKTPYKQNILSCLCKMILIFHRYLTFQILSKQIAEFPFIARVVITFVHPICRWSIILIVEIQFACEIDSRELIGLVLRHGIIEIKSWVLSPFIYRTVNQCAARRVRDNFRARAGKARRCVRGGMIDGSLRSVNSFNCRARRAA